MSRKLSILVLVIGVLCCLPGYVLSSSSLSFNITKFWLAVKAQGGKASIDAQHELTDILEHSGIKRLIDMAIEGFSTTCFCYGQTGSGKTHTLTGPPFLVCIY